MNNTEMITMLEQWEKWEPVQGLAAKYYVDSIVDAIDGFKVWLSDYNNENNKVLITFEGSVDSYRSVDESFRLNTINILDERYGSKFYGDWTFFKVTNSSYVQWLSEESYGISDSLSFIHFSIVAADSIVDIIDTCEPKVQLIRTS